MPPAEPVVVGLDGGYVRSRHRQDERHFEVIAGKVISIEGNQSRFRFRAKQPHDRVRRVSSRQLAMAGVIGGHAGDGAERRRCRVAAVAARASLPNATVVLDWWHAAVRFRNTRCRRHGALARPIRICPTWRFADWSAAKWRLWHGRWPGCRRKLAASFVPLGAAHLYAAWLALGAWSTS